MNAQHSVSVETAQQRYTTGLLRKLYHLVGCHLQKRVGEADLSIELDDSGSESITVPGYLLDVPRAPKKQEVTVRAGTRHPQRLRRVERCPSGTIRREQVHDFDEPLCT
jgi:hypothetical protein